MVRGGGHDALPYRIPDDHPGLLAAVDVLRSVYGQEPLKVRMGGTLPVSELFRRLLGIDTVFFSFSADEDFPHWPSSSAYSALYGGLKAWAMYWERLAR